MIILLIITYWLFFTATPEVIGIIIMIFYKFELMIKELSYLKFKHQVPVTNICLSVGQSYPTTTGCPTHLPLWSAMTKPFAPSSSWILGSDNAG